MIIPVMYMTVSDKKIATLCKLLRYQQDRRTRLAMLKLLSRLINPPLK
jgi:hypothetical protein